MRNDRFAITRNTFSATRTAVEAGVFCSNADLRIVDNLVGEKFTVKWLSPLFRLDHRYRIFSNDPDGRSSNTITPLMVAAGSNARRSQISQEGPAWAGLTSSATTAIRRSYGGVADSSETLA